MPSYLSREVLSEFTPDRRGVTGSKFIAVPGFVIVDAFSHNGLLSYWERMTEEQPGLLDAALKEIEEKQLGICGMHSGAARLAMFDAGFLSVSPSADQVEEVIIAERSRDYGGAMSPKGRLETVRIAQTAVGAEVNVTMAERY